MTQIFMEYALFLAQAVTIVAAIGAVAVLVLTLSRRESQHQPNLEITHLNERFEGLERQLQHALSSKAAIKADEKARKKAQKAKDKAEKQALKRSGADNRAETPVRRRVFVLDFKGDIKASGVSALREEVTALLTTATPEDEVLVRLDNAGGLVHEHGLAASQLMRLKNAGIRLTVAVDKVAASGGYMMACVADRIVAAPFAVLGSIGVLLQLPNFHRLLDNHGVDFEQVKGGEHKRSLTLFGENTDEDRDKAREDVEDTHLLFKSFVAEHRPVLDLSAVATGEHWYGVRAIDLKLCDTLQTSDDFLLEASRDADLYALHMAMPKPLGQRLAGVLESAWDSLMTRYAFNRRLGRLSA